LDDFYTGTGVAAITIEGVSDAELARHIIVEDCIITGSSGGDNQGIYIQLAENALVDNCTVSGRSFFSGIGFGNVSNLRCSNCSVFGGYISVGTAAPYTTPINSAVIENCSIVTFANIGIQVAAGPLPVPVSNVVITDCVISGAPYGIYLLAGAGDVNGNLKNILIQRCDFLDNAVGIFLYPPVPTATLSNVVIKDCLFVGGNRSNSFGLQIGGGSFEQLNNVVVTRCVSQNITNGFYDETVGTSRIFDHCIIQDAQTAFRSTSSYCQVINCCAETMQQNGFVGNNMLALANSSLNAQLSGFVGVSASLVKSGAAAASNATYWNNVAL
jgi:polygalacturonase